MGDRPAMVCGCSAPPLEAMYGLVDESSELLLELDAHGQVVGGFPHRSALLGGALCGASDLAALLPTDAAHLLADRAEVVRSLGVPTSLDIPRTELHARLAPHHAGVVVLLRRTTPAQQPPPIGDDSFWQLFEAAPVPLVVALSRTSTDNRPSRYNRRFTEVFGYAPEDVPTVQHWWPLAYPDPAYRNQIRDAWFERMRKAEAGQTSIAPIEATVTCKDGSTRVVEFFAAVVGDRNVVVFIPRPTLPEIEAGADLIAVCSWCKKVRDAARDWETIEQLLVRKLELRPTHGICPDCLGQYFKH